MEGEENSACLQAWTQLGKHFCFHALLVLRFRQLSTSVVLHRRNPSVCATNRRHADRWGRLSLAGRIRSRKRKARRAPAARRPPEKPFTGISGNGRVASVHHLKSVGQRAPNLVGRDWF